MSTCVLYNACSCALKQLTWLSMNYFQLARWWKLTAWPIFLECQVSSKSMTYLGPPLGAHFKAKSI